MEVHVFVACFLAFLILGALGLPSLPRFAISLIPADHASFARTISLLPHSVGHPVCLASLGQQEVTENRVNAQNPYYLSLRNGAIEAREKAFKSRENRRVAFIDGTSGYLTARELHHDFKNYMDAARRMDDKASDWIFHENNKFTRYGRVDLHSLKAHEAAVHTRRKLIEAKKEGVRQVTFIVGRALDKHSLRPLKVELNRVVKNLDFRSVVDPTNPGLLVVFTNNKDDNYIDRDAMEAPQRPEAE